VTKLRLLRAPAKFALNLSRTIPDLLFAALFAAVFGYGPLAGTLALTFFSFGILSKWAYEAIETVYDGPMEAMTAVGANKLQWIHYGVVSQVVGQFVGFALYMFEINIRAAAILGFVGAGGIGIYLNRTLGMFRYDQTLLIILFTLAIVVAIDAASSRIRGKLA
jgi:phosphonate transport system permease protein